MTENASYHPNFTAGSGSELETKVHKARVIAVTSGKGGVGKTNITTNLGIALATRGAKVCIFDADTNLANINILLGLTPKYTLEHLLKGEKSIDEVMMEGPRNVSVIPAASGIANLGRLNTEQRQLLIDTLEELEQRFDYLLIDTAAGAGETVQSFIHSAQYSIIVISPEPTSLTDAFSLIKVLKKKGYKKPLYVLVNMALNYENSMEVFNRFDIAVKKYLKTATHYLGYITLDETVITSVRLQQPVIIYKPDSPSSRCFYTLATGLGNYLPEKNEPSCFSAYWKEQTKNEETPSPEPLRDSEIMEVFTEEGVDIMDACDRILQRWSHDINDLEHTSKLQHELRTLKGGARMSRIVSISDVCRSAILLLGALIEGQQQATPDHITLMQKTLYTLSAMLQDIKDNRAPESANELTSELDRARSGIPSDFHINSSDKIKTKLDSKPLTEDVYTTAMNNTNTTDINSTDNTGIGYTDTTAINNNHDTDMDSTSTTDIDYTDTTDIKHAGATDTDNTDATDLLNALLNKLTNDDSINDVEQIMSKFIDAYTEQHQKYPIDIRKSLYHSLEMQDFPYSEIRDMALTLESLYEKRCQISIRDIDDTVIKLFEDVHGSEEKMQELGRQLRSSFKRQFSKNLYDPLVELVSHIHCDTYTEKSFNDQINTLKDAYKERFNKPYVEEAEKHLNEVREMTEKMATQEINLHEEFVRFTNSINSTLSSREELLAKLNPAPSHEDSQKYGQH